MLVDCFFVAVYRDTDCQSWGHHQSITHLFPVFVASYMPRLFFWYACFTRLLSTTELPVYLFKVCDLWTFHQNYLPLWCDEIFWRKFQWDGQLVKSFKLVLESCPTCSAKLAFFFLVWDIARTSTCKYVWHKHSGHIIVYNYGPQRFTSLCVTEIHVIVCIWATEIHATDSCNSERDDDNIKSSTKNVDRDLLDLLLP